MQLAVATLVPVATDVGVSTATELRGLLREMSTAEDNIEHVHVFEHSGIMWVGAYVASLDPDVAQDHLYRLCEQLRGIDTGWELLKGSLP